MQLRLRHWAPWGSLVAAVNLLSSRDLSVESVAMKCFERRALELQAEQAMARQVAPSWSQGEQRCRQARGFAPKAQAAHCPRRAF